MSTISQGLVKVVLGEKGRTSYKWWRISRTKLATLANRVSSENNFYYAKVYEYKRLGHKKGIVGNQIAYIYWKEGVLTYIDMR